MIPSTYQAARRNAARLRGDCIVCCKQPARPGRSRCEACDAWHRGKQNWKGRENRSRPRMLVREIRVPTLVPVAASFEIQHCAEGRERRVA